MDRGTGNGCCPTREVHDAEAVVSAERELAAWCLAQEGVAGVEVHDDPDATWLVHPGMVWANCVVNVRFATGTAPARLDRILACYRKGKRGAGFWISPFATPAELTGLLKARGLRCRKHFPVMFLDLKSSPTLGHSKPGLRVSVIDDHSIFETRPHPYFGDISTPLRRFELARLAWLNQSRPRRVWDFVAWRDGMPVSACTLFKHGAVAGFHDVGTLLPFRGQGIATALMQQACAFACEQGCERGVLVASGAGHGMYRRAGFRNAGPLSYWFRTFRPVNST